MLQAIEGNRLRLRWILVTHAHRAHIAGIRACGASTTPRSTATSPACWKILPGTCRTAIGSTLGEIGVEVIELPGHSIDSLCFLVGRMLFSGDTLSAGSVGRTRDGYALGLLLSGIRRRLLALGDDVVLFPGHGPPSRIGIERRFNPFLAGEPSRDPAAAT